jgi:hypothetical protein
VFAPRLLQAVSARVHSASSSLCNLCIVHNGNLLMDALCLITCCSSRRNGNWRHIKTAHCNLRMKFVNLLLCSHYMDALYL